MRWGSNVVTVGGGCAANAAVAIARLGGEASFAGPLGGPAGQEPISDRIVAGLARERVDSRGCVRLDGAASALSAIFVNKRGERTIATYRDHRLEAVTPPDADALVVGLEDVRKHKQMLEPGRVALLQVAAPRAIEPLECSGLVAAVDARPRVGELAVGIGGHG